MKSYFSYLRLAAITAGMVCLAGCVREEGSTEADESVTRPSPTDGEYITFRLDGPAVILTRAHSTRIASPTRASLAEANITDVEVYESGVLLMHQQSSEAEFGTLIIPLRYGQHTLRFIAHRSLGTSVSDGTWRANEVRQTYQAEVSLDVTTADHNAPDRSLTLERAVWHMMLQIDDAIPTDVAKVRVQVGIYYDGFSLATLQGVECELVDRMREFDITSAQGIEGVKVSLFGFAPTYGEAYQAQVDMTFLDASDAVVMHHKKTDVPLRTDYQTIIKGNYFTGEPLWTLTVDTSYDGEFSLGL